MDAALLATFPLSGQVLVRAKARWASIVTSRAWSGLLGINGKDFLARRQWKSSYWELTSLYP